MIMHITLSTDVIPGERGERGLKPQYFEIHLTVSPRNDAVSTRGNPYKVLLKV